MERLLVMRSEAPLTEVGATFDTSWKISSLMVPPSETCGLILSVKPTSLRSIVWKGLATPPALGGKEVPVMNGTFWPTTILASALSSVMRLGVDRMFAKPRDSRARANAPKPVMMVPSGSLSWPRKPSSSPPALGNVGGTAPPTSPALALTRLGLPPGKFCNARAVPLSVFLPPAHWTPSSRAAVVLISTISASTYTWVRRTSSFSITPRRLL